MQEKTPKNLPGARGQSRLCFLIRVIRVIRGWSCFRPYERTPVVKAGNFLRILAVALALSGYSAWMLSVRDKPASPAPPDQFVAGIPLLSLAQAESLWQQD